MSTADVMRLIRIGEPNWNGRKLLDPYKLALFEEIWGGGIASERATVTGVSPLSLPDALAKNIVSLLQKGIVEQNGTPTPSSPVDIKCNNGTLTVKDEELPYGYKRLSGIQMQDARIVVPFYLTGEDTLRFRAQGTSGNWIGSFNDASANDNLSFYGSTNSGAKYARYNGQTGGSSIYTNTWYDVVVSPTGVTGTRNPSSFTPATFTCSEPLNIGATSIEGTPGPNVSFEGNIVVDGRLTLIPCERQSDNALGYYDGTAFYTSEIGTLTSLGYDTSHLVLTVVGTPEVITLGTQTASAEDLLAVGDYKDEQEIITGSVKRKVGVKVLDGTETGWGTSGVNGFTLPLDNAQSGTDKTIVCSHFPYDSLSSGQCCRITNDGLLLIIYPSLGRDATLNDWKAYLVAQYAAGTPVIVIYPLATETTETVDPQPLSTTAGDNTIIVTAEVSNIPLEVTYVKKK